MEKTIFMRKADWEKWDAALRSGEYEQGKEALCTVDGKYCCLGVLQHCLTGEVEVWEDDGCVPEDEVGTAHSVPTREWMVRYKVQFRGKDFRRELGTYEPAPYLPSLDLYATQANDGKFNPQSSFIEIADAIKEAVEFTD